MLVPATIAKAHKLKTLCPRSVFFNIYEINDPINRKIPTTGDDQRAGDKLHLRVVQPRLDRVSQHNVFLLPKC